MRLRILVGEAYRSARALRSFSVLFGLVAFVTVASVVLLMGQAQAQRAEVLETFSRPELRTFEIVDENGLGIIPWQTARRSRALSSVDSAWVLGAAFDVSNGALPDRGRVSAQMVSGDWRGLPVRLVSGRFPRGGAEALASASSARTIGIDSSGGWVLGPGDATWAVVGTYVPSFSSAPASVLVPATAGAHARSVLVTVDTLSKVDTVAGTVASLTDRTGAGQLSVHTSGDAQRLDRSITDAVGRSSATIVVSVMTAAFVVLTFLAILMVSSRRQEFGRRRALGATRDVIVGLVLVQGCLVVAVAAVLGSAAGWLVSWLWFDYSVPPDFLLAVALTAVAGSAVAQTPSAVAAGLRDPVRVLRTP